MQTITIHFRNADEAADCDLTRLGNPSASTADGLTVRVEDVDLTEWSTSSEGEAVLSAEDLQRGAIRAALAACGVWAEVS